MRSDKPAKLAENGVFIEVRIFRACLLTVLQGTNSGHSKLQRRGIMSAKPKNNNKDGKGKPTATTDLRNGMHGSVASGSPIFAALDPVVSDDTGPAIASPDLHVQPGQTTHE